MDHVTPVARQIVDEGQDWTLWALCDGDPILTWVNRCVALLGDAAHPMPQYFAQRARMAPRCALGLSQVPRLAPHRPGRP